MKNVITIGWKKGGTGKSTICCMLASFLSKKGNKVTILDTDINQYSCANWKKYNSDENIKCLVVRNHTEIEQFINQRKNIKEFVIIDVGGFDTIEYRQSLILSDVVLLPIRPSQQDLDALNVNVEIFKKAKNINESIKFLSVISQAFFNAKENLETIDYIKSIDFDNLSLLRTVIYSRKAYRDCFSYGTSVFDMKIKNKKALDEIDRLGNELLKCLKK